MPIGWGGILGDPTGMNIAPVVCNWLNEHAGLRSHNLVDFKANARAGISGWFYGQRLVNSRGYGNIGGWISKPKAHVFYLSDDLVDISLLFKLTWAGFSAVE